MNMNLRFIKPSHNFYNKVMTIWFKYTHIMEESEPEIKLVPAEIKKQFIQFYISNAAKCQDWNDNFMKPLDVFAQLIANEYCSQRQNTLNEDGQFSMLAFFDMVKTALLKLWEQDIIQKSS